MYVRSCLVALVLGSAGCASPPEVVDLTPRFTQGERRIESLASYATVRTPVKDLNVHLGLSWEATVTAVGPEGATIDCTMRRVVAKLPVVTLDTDAILPFHQLVDLGKLLFGLVGARFQYIVASDGGVSVSGWSDIVGVAAAGASLAVPTDGSVPSQVAIAEALRRVYAPMPRRPVRLGESWGYSEEYGLCGEHGPRLVTNDAFTYRGLGELELLFGGDEVEVEGLELTLKGTPEVNAAGLLFLGHLDLQSGRRWGTVITSEDGRAVRAYREGHGLTISPARGLLPVDVEVAALEIGWLFFAEDDWER